MQNRTHFSSAAHTGARLARWARGLLLAVPALVGVAGTAHAGFTTFESGGIDAAAITPTRDAFRSAVGGGSVAGANGNFGGLRREINWDGVPDTRSDPNPLPADFFLLTSPRGVAFSSPDAGAGFLVSANAATASPTLFGFPDDLQTFSAQRLFATTGSRVTDIRFFVPDAPGTAATTSAFGAVFVDAESNDSTHFTKMEFFDANDALIYSHTVTAVNFHPDGSNRGGLSFLGGVANAGEQIARVRITTPDNYLISNGVRLNESTDFVVMDDFLYATPAAVPEPEIWAMALLGLGVVGWRSRRRSA